uniref:Transcriptional regulator n=1 Tax=Macrostomum lignano TaxID=282301 RepID=A0A1I8I254_9PLAT
LLLLLRLRQGRGQRRASQLEQLLQTDRATASHQQHNVGRLRPGQLARPHVSAIDSGQSGAADRLSQQLVLAKEADAGLGRLILAAGHRVQRLLAGRVQRPLARPADSAAAATIEAAAVGRSQLGGDHRRGDPAVAPQAGHDAGQQNDSVGLFAVQRLGEFVNQAAVARPDVLAVERVQQADGAAQLAGQQLRLAVRLGPVGAVQQHLGAFVGDASASLLGYGGIVGIGRG